MKSKLHKTLRVISIVVLAFFTLSLYSFFVYDAAIKGKHSSFIAEHLTNFANYPQLVKEVLTSKEVSNIPVTYLKLDDTFKDENHLSYDLFALNSFWNSDKNEWNINLFNLKNDIIVYQWKLPKTHLDFSATSYKFDNAAPRNCIALPEKNLIVSTDECANLMRLDANSKILWADHSHIYHHSLNLDADSNIWACTSDLNKGDKTPVKGIATISGEIYRYQDNYITLIDKNTGKTLFHKSVTEILIENNYSNFVYGLSDPDRINHDPIHLNDIEPVLKDSKYWKKGDVFISIRHRSLILLYRPSTNKILRLIYGNFFNQHDIDITSDQEISIFNNNYIFYEKDNSNLLCTVVDTLHSSEVISYSLKDSTLQKPFNKLFIQENIWTETQGLYTHISNGDLFVESQNQGKLFILNNKGVVYKKMLHAPLEGYAYYPNWIRIYEHLPF